MNKLACLVHADARGQFHLSIKFERCDLQLALLEGMSREDVLSLLQSDGLVRLLSNIHSAPAAAIQHPRLSAGILTNLCFDAEGSKTDEYSPEGMHRCLEAMAKARVQWHEAGDRESGSGYVSAT